jgi:hypothetical protein
VRKIIQKALSQERAVKDGSNLLSSDPEDEENDDEEMKEDDQDDEAITSTCKDQFITPPDIGESTIKMNG